jgi:hypothetical protein
MSDVHASQPAAETPKAPAQPDAAVEGAQTTDELASFFKEYEEKVGQPQPQPTPEVKPAQADAPPPWAADIIAKHQQIEAVTTKREVEDLLKTVKGDLDVAQFAVRGWIDQKADEDPRIKRIFEQRHVNPAAFMQMADRMQKQFRKEAAAFAKSRVDEGATEDKAAVTAAVRGASTKAPDDKPPNVSRMTDAEFAAYKRSLGL